MAQIELHRTWLGREIYSKTMGNNLKRLFNVRYFSLVREVLKVDNFQDHVDILKTNPRLDIEAVQSGKYITDFDRYVQVFKFCQYG